ncbi:GNAT family N-acetyltransferase [Chryseobacterium sp. Mn2064]|uniref:GNAT family N-acetyltransferase n=1 Tax=Chryseobacterium sp. Mn2064 TaxID=3395263 RepID=UPI003BED791C
MNSNTSSNQRITFRKGHENDLPEMRRLFTETIETTCRNDYDEKQRIAWKSGAENEERWLKVIKEQYVLVAVLHNKIVGFCTLDQRNYIDLLFIHKDHQQQRIASTLYKQIEDKAIEQNSMSLAADVSKTAKPFFEKKGFHTLREQLVSVNNVHLTNYKMIKKLI